MAHDDRCELDWCPDGCACLDRSDNASRPWMIAENKSGRRPFLSTLLRLATR